MQSEKKPGGKNTPVDKPKKAVTKVTTNSEASETKMEENVTAPSVSKKRSKLEDFFSTAGTNAESAETKRQKLSPSECLFDVCEPE